jgi:hypothetical protein
MTAYPSRATPGCDDDCPSGEFFPGPIHSHLIPTCNGDGHYRCPECAWFAGPAPEPQWLTMIPLEVAYPGALQRRLPGAGA